MMIPLNSDEDHAYNKRPYSFPSKEMGSGVTMDKDVFSFKEDTSLIEPTIKSFIGTGFNN
ncbi:unnamed protein product [Gadus morhua 'NCC']